SIKAEYRYFTDTWGIDAQTFELAYVHPLGERWTIEGKVRFYTQSAADFYGDLFPYQNSQTHLGRDKELSSFAGTTLGTGVTYEWKQARLPGIDRVRFNLLLDYLDFRYDNFRDVTAPGNYLPGNEPLYQFDAFVTRASMILDY
ncbi:MAG: DUF3570 domain-containing protein, partial [Marinobacter sp.]|nr:DUF3570 domain-containing protein [Marinobacter sp.]